MPVTQSLITSLLEEIDPSISRPRYREYLNRIQRALFNNDCAQSVWYNTADISFPWPVLKTVAGTLEYEITAANLINSAGAAISSIAVNGVTVAPRRIRSVFISTASIVASGYNPKFRGAEITPIGINPYWQRKLYNNRYYSAVGQPFDKTDLQGCKWIFDDDPGATTNCFYVEFFYAPPNISAETGAGSYMVLDSDKWEQCIYDGVAACIEDMANGGSQKFQKFQEYWIPRFLQGMNEGSEMRTPLRMPIRECL